MTTVSLEYSRYLGYKPYKRSCPYHRVYLCTTDFFSSVRCGPKDQIFFFFFSRIKCIVFISFPTGQQKMSQRQIFSCVGLGLLIVYRVASNRSEFINTALFSSSSFLDFYSYCASCTNALSRD